MARPRPTFYVFHGSDEFTRAETVADLRRQMESSGMADMNTVWLDGRKVTLSELRHACETIPFLAKRRLVLVTGLLSRLEKGESPFLDGLLDLLAHLPETARLILIEEKALGKKHPVLTLAQESERGYVRQFEPPTPKGLPQWIIQRAQKQGGEMDLQAAARLAQVVGTDLRLLDQEIGKLITYVGPGQKVTVEDVERLVPYVQEAIIFDLVDALGQRDGRAAASTLHGLLEEGENPMGILAMVVRQFRLLAQVKELRQQGENAASISRILGVHPYPAGKLYRQAANFTAAQLEHIYRHLLTTDLQIKSGELTPEVALNLLVAGLAGGKG